MRHNKSDSCANCNIKLELQCRKCCALLNSIFSTCRFSQPPSPLPRIQQPTLKQMKHVLGSKIKTHMCKNTDDAMNAEG